MIIQVKPNHSNEADIIKADAAYLGVRSPHTLTKKVV